MQNEPQASFLKYFRTEVVAAFAIGSVVAGAVVSFMSPIGELNTQVAVIKTQIDNIKNNDLTHIFAAEAQNVQQLNDIQKQVNTITNQLAAIQALLNQRK